MESGYRFGVHHRALVGFVVTAALSLTACVDLPEGIFGCTTAAECPDGWFCRDDGRCYETDGPGEVDGGDPDSDGGATDGGMDAGRTDGGGIDDDGGATDAGFDAGVDAGFDAGTDGGPPCTGAFACVPVPAAPFMGPFARADAESLCGGSYPTGAGEYGTGTLGGATPSCDCACSGSPTVNCGTHGFVLGYSVASCVPPEDTSLPLMPGDCAGTLSLQASRSVSGNMPTSFCATGTVTPDIPPVNFPDTLALCESSTPVGIACPVATDVCMQRPEGPLEGQLCVVAPGETVACPAGYPDRTVVYTGFSDGRGCPSSCSCQAINVECAMTFTIFDAENCMGTATTVAVSDPMVRDCSPSVAQSVRLESIVPQGGSCDPMDPAVTGAATPTGAQTVCCTSAL